MSLTVASTVRHTPRLPLQTIADTILGSDYELSVAFVGATRARALNRQTRGKAYIPNVLAFPLTEQVGEIYLCPTAANREAKHFSLSPRGYLTYLFIHGCLHLRGYEHGPAMEQREARYCAEFHVR